MEPDLAQMMPFRPSTVCGEFDIYTRNIIINIMCVYSQGPKCIRMVNGAVCMYTHAGMHT